MGGTNMKVLAALYNSQKAETIQMSINWEMGE